jgi:2-keto-4-pentenoate hydratase
VRIGGGGGGSTREGKREEAAVAEAVGEPPLAALAWIFLAWEKKLELFGTFCFLL